jgi:hypothetical protein
MSLEVRQRAERELQRIQMKTGLPLETILRYAGIPQRTWREWIERRGVETKHNNNIPKAYYLTPDEVQAIVLYCIANPLKGYRHTQPSPQGEGSPLDAVLGDGRPKCGGGL